MQNSGYRINQLAGVTPERLSSDDDPATRMHAANFSARRQHDNVPLTRPMNCANGFARESGFSRACRAM
jgi:hypothetical protein